MIAYRAELWCDGCGVQYGKGSMCVNPDYLPERAASIEEVAVKGDRWVKDGAAHFCPRCQVQRGKAA